MTMTTTRPAGFGPPPHTPNPSPTLKGGEGRPHPIGLARRASEENPMRRFLTLALTLGL